VQFALGQPQAIARDLQRQNASAIIADGGRHAAGGALLDEEDDTSPTAGAAGFCPEAPIFRRHCDELINQRCGNSWGIRAAEFPLFTKQAADFVPIAMHQRLVHGAGDFGDACKITVHVLVAADASAPAKTETMITTATVSATPIHCVQPSELEKT